MFLGNTPSSNNHKKNKDRASKTGGSGVAALPPPAQPVTVLALAEALIGQGLVDCRYEPLLLHIVITHLLYASLT